MIILQMHFPNPLTLAMKVGLERDDEMKFRFFGQTEFICYFSSGLQYLAIVD